MRCSYAPREYAVRAPVVVDRSRYAICRVLRAQLRAVTARAMRRRDATVFDRLRAAASKDARWMMSDGVTARYVACALMPRYARCYGVVVAMRYVARRDAQVQTIIEIDDAQRAVSAAYKTR